MMPLVRISLLSPRAIRCTFNMSVLDVNSAASRLSQEAHLQGCRAGGTTTGAMRVEAALYVKSCVENGMSRKEAIECSRG